MNKIKNYNVNLLSSNDLFLINGGDAEPGSYGIGYLIGAKIRSMFSGFADNYRSTHIWGA